MPRSTLSTNMLKAMNSGDSTDEVIAILLQISHPSLSEPIYLTNERQNLVNEGHTYMSFPFQFDLPDAQEGQVPQAQLTLDNTDLSLMSVLSELGQTPATIMMTVVLASQPTVIEWPWVTFLARDIQGDAHAINITLSYNLPTDETYPAHHIDPYHCPQAFTRPVIGIGVPAA